MRVEDRGKLLRIYVDESCRYEGKPVYEAVVETCRREGIAGASVFRGIMGYGADQKIHAQRVLRLSADLPVMVEIVDSPENIDLLIPLIEAMIEDGLMTVENVQVIRYSRAQRSGED